MAPAVGWIKPATSRNRLDLPQPDGPTMTENSFSSTSREMRSSAVTGCPIRGVKRRMTLSMRSLPMFGGPRASGAAGPGQQPIPDELEELVGNQAEQPDHHDAEEDEGDLFFDAEAAQEEEQWDQGRAREIANEIGARLDRRLDDLEAAHQDAERHRDHRGDDEARHDLGDTRRRVHEERAVPGHVDARLDDGDGGRQEIRAHQPAIAERAPGEQAAEPHERTHREVNPPWDLPFRCGIRLEERGDHSLTNS